MFCSCVASSVIYTLIAHAQEPMKLFHLCELLYIEDTTRLREDMDFMFEWQEQ